MRERNYVNIAPDYVVVGSGPGNSGQANDDEYKPQNGRAD